MDRVGESNPLQSWKDACTNKKWVCRCLSNGASSLSYIFHCVHMPCDSLTTDPPTALMIAKISIRGIFFFRFGATRLVYLMPLAATWYTQSNV